MTEAKTIPTETTKAPKPKSLAQVISSAVREFPDDEEITLFRDWFKERYGDNLAAVIFFGSCLSEKSRSETSFKDFVVVVDDYFKTSKNPVQWLSHWLLPPDLFHLALKKEGRDHECKYYLISMRQLLDAVMSRAKDLYVMGRMSKRIAIIYCRDDETFDRIVFAQKSAMQNAAEMSLALLDVFDLEGFIKAVMRLSYLAETRLEDERKVASLYAAHTEFYKTAYGIILADIIKRNIVKPEGQGWRTIGAKLPCTRMEIDQFLVLSRKRAKARWPKMIITVDNWLDQLLGKLERTYNIKLDIPKWERPIILITGWRHYFRLKRDGKIH
jgi:hypothetical protein